MNEKKNNNEVLEQLKNDLKEVANQIPKSETELFLDFMKNVWAKMFVVKNNDNPLDIRFVISYIDNRMKNTKNKQHQAFWVKIYKMLLDAKENLEKI
ncbi:MAG: hypothetical protein ACOC80_11465 [Petrotogales bacterium]